MTKFYDGGIVMLILQSLSTSGSQYFETLTNFPIDW